HVVLDVLLGKERAARRDLAEKRQRVDLGFRPPAPAGELEGAGLRRVAPEEPGPLEVCEMRVHRRWRGEPDRLADLAHGGWVAVALDVADEELPDLLLARGQRHLVSL